MNKTMNYTLKEIQSLIEQFDLLIGDVEALTDQLRKAHALNEKLIAQNCQLSMTLESVGVVSTEGTFH